jgi:hypothetical protein
MSQINFSKQIYDIETLLKSVESTITPYNLVLEYITRSIAQYLYNYDINTDQYHIGLYTIDDVIGKRALKAALNEMIKNNLISRFEDEEEFIVVYIAAYKFPKM